MYFGTWVIVGEKWIRSAVLKIYSPNQQHQYHSDTWNAGSQASSTPAESEALGAGPSSLSVTGPPGDFSDVCYSLRITGLMLSLPRPKFSVELLSFWKK